MCVHVIAVSQKSTCIPESYVTYEEAGDSVVHLRVLNLLPEGELRFDGIQFPGRYLHGIKIIELFVVFGIFFF